MRAWPFWTMFFNDLTLETRFTGNAAVLALGFTGDAKAAVAAATMAIEEKSIASVGKDVYLRTERSMMRMLLRQILDNWGVMPCFYTPNSSLLQDAPSAFR